MNADDIERALKTIDRWSRHLDQLEPETVGDAVDIDMHRDDLEHLRGVVQAARQAPTSGEPEPVAEVVSGYSGDPDTINNKAIKILNLEHCRIGTLLYPQSPAKVPEGWLGIIKDAHRHLTNWMQLHGCDCEYGHTCGYIDVHNTAQALADLLATPTPATKAQPVQQGSVPEGHVAIPKDVAAAKGMYLVGYSWLKHNAPQELATPQSEGDGWIEPDLFWDCVNPEDSGHESAYELADYCASDMPADETMVVNVLCAKMLPSRKMKIWVDENDDLQWEWITPPTAQEGK